MLFDASIAKALTEKSIKETGGVPERINLLKPLKTRELKRWISWDLIQNLSDQELRDKKNKKWKETMDFLEKCPLNKTFFSEIKRIFKPKDKPPIISSVNIRNEIILTREEQINSQKELIEDATKCKLIPHTPKQKLYKIRHFLRDAINKGLTKFYNYNKAAGPDGIHSIWIKHLKQMYKDKKIEELIDIADFHLSKPDFFETRPVLINKNKDESKIKVRPIQVGNASWKILEKGILDDFESQLTWHYKDRQYGFFKGRSTFDATSKLLDLQYDKDKEKLFFIDLTCAYNTVN